MATARQVSRERQRRRENMRLMPRGFLVNTDLIDDGDIASVIDAFGSDEELAKVVAEIRSALNDGSLSEDSEKIAAVLRVINDADGLSSVFDVTLRRR